MIDQDSDFIAFLESLTNPIQKASPDAWMEEPKEEIPVVTPLIQYMKDKKAKQTRSKDSTGRPLKAPMRESKETRADRNKKVTTRAEREKEKREKIAGPSIQLPEKPKDKPAKEPVKSVKTGRAPGTPELSAAKDKGVKELKQKDRAPPTAPAADRKKDKGKTIIKPQILRREPTVEQSADAARPARTPKDSREPRDGKAKDVKGKAEEKTTVEKEAETATSATLTSTPITNVAPPTEPAPKPPRAPRNRREKARERAKAKSEESNNNAPNPPTGPKASMPSESGTPAAQETSTKSIAAGTSRPTTASSKQAQSTQTPAPAQPATQAFLKHANPSQGVTEENLLTGFSVFGQVLKTEIDKKKGFGYVYFAEPEALKKAIQASPVQIADSKVVVLERKTGPQIAMSRGGRGGGGAVRSGAGTPPAQPPAQPQSLQTQTVQNQSQPPAPATVSATQGSSQAQNNQASKQPPTAPAAERAAAGGNGKAPPTGPRGGRSRHHRGPRGGNRSGNKASGSASGNAPASAPAAAPSGSSAQ